MDFDVNGPVISRCPECNGRGRKRGKACVRCNGAGWLQHIAEVKDSAILRGGPASDQGQTISDTIEAFVRGGFAAGSLTPKETVIDVGRAVHTYDPETGVEYRSFSINLGPDTWRSFTQTPEGYHEGVTIDGTAEAVPGSLPAPRKTKGR